MNSSSQTANQPASLLGRPSDPRLRCIEWAWGEPPRIDAFEGNFSTFGLTSDNQKTDSAQLQALIGESQIEKVITQFETAIDEGLNPATIELKLTHAGQTFWVEQEAALAIGDDNFPRLYTWWYDITAKRQAEKTAGRLTQVIDAIPSWIFLKNEDHQYELVNESYASVYGLKPQQCVGKNSIELGVPEEIAKGNPVKGIRGFWADDNEVLTSAKPKTIQCEPIVIDDETRYLQTIKTPIVEAYSERQLLVGFCHDITYLKQIEDRIRLELRHNKTLNELNALLRSEDDPYLTLNRVTSLLSRAFDKAGITIACCGPNQQTLEQESLIEPKVIHTVPIGPDGAKLANLNAAFYETNPTDSDKALLLSVGEKLTAAFQRHELHQKIHFQANHDSLTALPNRSSFLKKLEDAVAGDQNCAVVMLDLDGFKAINDTHGHLFGDKTLVAVAKRLEKASLESDIIARLGGDEFAILLHDVDNQADSIKRAEYYLEQLDHPFSIAKRDLMIGGSFGVSFYSHGTTAPDTLLQRADWAMYSAKESGRNNCHYFTQEIADKVQHRTRIENALRLAIHSKDQFQLEYQPKFDLATMRVVGMEALVRWQHPEMGTIPAQEFMQIAETTGLIIPLGQWILENSCESVSQWNSKLSQPIELAINVSPPELEYSNLIPQIASIVERTDFNPRNLVLELTETFVMKCFDSASRKLKQLQKQGVNISIDDFGSGSSLSYLLRLPIDRLKIDQCFVQMLDGGTTPPDSRRASIAKAVLSLGKTLGLEIVAEGIKTQQQLQQIHNIGADVGQGLFLSKPLTPDKAFEFICQQNGQ